jgi:molybdenum cofactor cytidylyltransferase
MRNAGAVILAAGGSSRFGDSKQLLNFRGETLVGRAVRVAEEAHCSPVVVVVGESGKNAITDSLRGTSALIVENLDWQRGLGTSIRRGLEQLIESAPATDAVILLTCDQPLLDANTITALIAEQDETRKPIVASSYAKTFGVPALFDRSCFEVLLALPNSSGAKSLIAARPDDVASIAFEDGAIDIDTPSDFQRLIAEFG